MPASRTITLFAPPPPVQRGPSPLIASVAVHVAACAWILLGMRSAPHISSRPVPHRFTVRVLNLPELHEPQEAIQYTPPPSPTPKAITAPPAPRPSVQVAAASPAAAPPAPAPAAAPDLAKLAPKTQILVQPDAPPDIQVQQAAVPSLLRWTPPPMAVKVITPAPAKPVVANMKRSLQTPNREAAPAEVRLSSTRFSTTMPMLPPSTTTPIAVRAAEAPQRVPETSSRQGQASPSAQVMSLSDLKATGPVAVPLANTAAKSVTSAAALGTGTNSAANGSGKSTTAKVGTSNSAGSSGSGERGAGAGSSGTAVASGGSGSGPGSGELNGSAGAIDETKITRYHKAKDGQFGVVVVGTSLADQYPETVSVWGGRLVYSVYLHLGPGKAWILQYSLPASAQTASGTIRPDAPWPYDIVQPHLDPSDYTTDAVMVHGFVNLAGKFERLGVIFPTQFPQSKFVLAALQQWQFRPARQNGQLAQVEVLLIIPEQDE